MDNDQKEKSTDEEADKSQVDFDRKTKRSSILKPQKPRNPFTALDFSEPNPDNTLAKAARRVSFASSNLVKPFAADPEKNTIWDTTYEEEVNHTDSTKSSYEHSYEVKSNEFLNVTSIYSPESDQLDISVPKIWEEVTHFLAFNKENIKPNSKDIDNAENISIDGKSSVMLPLEAQTNKAVDLTLADKENVYIFANNGIASSQINTVFKKKSVDTVKHDFSVITSFNETINTKSQNNPYVEETMEITNVINKENFNPLINDKTLIASLERSSKKDIKSKSVNENTISTLQNVSLEDGKDCELVSTNLENLGEHTIIGQSDMELTKPIFVTDIKENIVGDVTISDINSKNRTVHFVNNEMNLTKVLSAQSKTVYFDGTQSNLNFTKTIFASNIKECNAIEQDISANLPMEENISSRKTIYMDQSMDNMEFTCNLPVKTLDELNLKMEADTKISLSSKELTNHATNIKYDHNIEHSSHKRSIVKSNPHVNHTILFNELEGDVELTSTLPQMNHIISQHMTLRSDTLKAEETIFDQNMDIIVTSPVSNNTLIKNVQPNTLNNMLRRKTIHFNQFDDDMDITIPSTIGTIKESKVENANTMCFSQIGGDMDLTSIIPVKEHINLQQNNLNNENPENLEKDFSQCRLNIDIMCEKNVGEISVDKGGSEKSEPSTKVVQDIENSIKGNINLNVLKNQQEVIELEHSISNINTNIADQHYNHKTQQQKSISISGIVPIEQINQNTLKDNCQSNDAENHASGITDTPDLSGIKRFSNSENDGAPAIKRKFSMDQSQLQSQLSNHLMANTVTYNQSSLSDKHIENKISTNLEKFTSIDNIFPTAESELGNTSNIQQNNKDQKVNLQTSTLSNSNILYSEPMKMKLKTHNLTPIPDLCDNLTLQSLNGSLNLKFGPTSTPTTSFHMTLTDMSPCTEDTQQLIYATFSKPDVLSLKEGVHSKNQLPLSDKEKCDRQSDEIICSRELQHQVINDAFKKDNDAYISENESSDKRNTFKIDTKTFVKENVKRETEIEKEMKTDVINLFSKNYRENADDLRAERNCYMEDESQIDFTECNDFSLNSPMHVEQIKFISEGTKSRDSTPKNSSLPTSDPSNYTLRLQLVLPDFKRYLQNYKIVIDEDHCELITLAEQSKKQNALIKDLLSNLKNKKTKIQIVDLEEKCKQGVEENSSNVSESVSNCEDDKGVPSTVGLIAPKSLHECICKAAERCKNYWRLEKFVDDEYYFLTLFDSLPFKVHIHPDLRIVYNVKTCTNLKDSARRICWYELKLFQHKLKEENLLLVLGAKFDIFTLLDYVYMTMEEIISLHLEYITLVKLYGVSHHFRMNQDFSISFEIINIDLIIHWIITINMSPTTSISKEHVSAVSVVGQKVNEEDIKCIAENTPRGSKFLSNFIENVNEYVKRIIRRIGSEKFRR